MIRKLFASLLLVVAFAAPVSAQETPEVEPTPVIIVDETPEDTVTVPSWFITNSGVLFFAAGAITVLITSAIDRRSLKQALENVDKSHKDAIEAAYEVVPDHVQDAFQRVIYLAENLTGNFMAVLEFVKGVTDGKENPPPAAG